MSNNKKTTKERLAILETTVKGLKESLDKFVDNEFHSLVVKMDKLKGRPSWAVAIVITSLVGTVIFLAQFIVTH